MDESLQQPGSGRSGEGEEPILDPRLIELSEKIFPTVEAFSNELENVNEVCITNNPTIIKSGKTKNIFRCVGSDGQFYMFLRFPDQKVRFIGVVENLRDVDNFINMAGNDLLK